MSLEPSSKTGSATKLGRRTTRSMSRRAHETPDRGAAQSRSTSGFVESSQQRLATSASAIRKRSTGKKSRFYPSPWAEQKATDSPAIVITPKVVLEKMIRQAGKPLTKDRFGLIQESIAYNLYALVVQAILWNQTTGKQARPVLEQMLYDYPTPEALAAGKFEDIQSMLYPIGLYNSRAKRLLDMAKMWVAKPPVAGRGYTKARDRKYTDLPLEEVKLEATGEANIKPQLSEEVLEHDLPTKSSFWEIAHLPGVGPYALDSFRIFHRDVMRGIAEDWLGTGAAPDFEPEWKRVVPLDKELRAYLKWLWANEGWDWNWETGRRESLKVPAVKQGFV